MRPHLVAVTSCPGSYAATALQWDISLSSSAAVLPRIEDATYLAPVQVQRPRSVWSSQ